MDKSNKNIEKMQKQILLIRELSLKKIKPKF